MHVSRKRIRIILFLSLVGLTLADVAVFLVAAFGLWGDLDWSPITLSFVLVFVVLPVLTVLLLRFNLLIWLTLTLIGQLVGVILALQLLGWVSSDGLIVSPDLILASVLAYALYGLVIGGFFETVIRLHGSLHELLRQRRIKQ